MREKEWIQHVGIFGRSGRQYTGSAGKDPVYFTSGLFESGAHQDEEKRIALVKKGPELLRQPDAEDADYMLLRVIEKDKICRTGRSGLGF
jgi:hypothetical protein